MRELFRVLLLFLLVLGSAALPDAGEARAQAIHLAAEDAPLGDVLAAVRAQSRVDVVFARRLVEGRTARCQYAGEKAAEALACALRGTGLHAQRVRRRQFVIVEGASDTSAAAQTRTLTGFVADAETGEVLPGAHVYLPELKVGTTTNAAGYFALAGLPPRAYPVRVSYVGYQPADTLLAAAATPVRFGLTPRPIETEEVVVEAAPDEEQEAAETAPGALALTATELDRLPSFLGEPDLFRALAWTPSIQKAGTLGGGLSVRGGQTDQNLYLLDGAPLYHPWHAFSLLSTFQTSTLKNVTLYRGGFPAEHGGRLSSVMQAQMKDGGLDKPRAEGALSLVSGRFLIETPVNEKTSVMLSGRRSYIDKVIGRQHPVSDGGRRDTLRTGYFFSDLSAKITTRPADGQRFSLSYYHGRDDLDLRLPFDLSLDVGSWLRPADLFFEVGQGWQNRLVSGRHQYLYSDRLFLTTTAYYSGYQAREGSLVQPTTSAALLSDYRVNLYDIGLRLDADYYLDLSHELRAGLHVVRRSFASTLDATIQRAPGTAERQQQQSDQRALEVTGYVQDTWKPSPRWTVRPGLRASFFSSGRYLRLSPRLSVQHIADPRWLTLRASADLRMQYIHRLRDRYSLAYDLTSSRWVPSSAAVRPSTNTEVSAEAESRPWPWLTLSLGGYARHARDVLLPEDAFRTKDALEGPGIDVGALLGQYEPARTRGVGVEASAQMAEGPWQLLVSYTGGRSFVRAEGAARERPDRFDVPRTLRTTAAYTGRRWNAGLAATLRSGYPITVPTAQYALGDALGEEPTVYLSRPEVGNGRLPPYLRLDATLGYRFRAAGARWRAQLHLFNATGRRNVIDRQYRPADGGVQTTNRRGLPILPLFEIEMKL